MKIICDKNIWYNIGNELVTPDPTHQFYCTYITLEEFCTTKNHIYNAEIAKKAIQAMMTLSSKNLILDPPFVFLKKLDDPLFKYDSVEKHENMLTFTEKIANGYPIAPDKIQEYEKRCEDFNQSYERGTIYINQEADQIRKRVKGKKDKHLKEDTLKLIES